MKYKVFFTDSLNTLKNEQLLGGAETFQEACRLIKMHLPEGEMIDYWRFLLDDTATFIDYGSRSHFAAIIPPVPVDEMR